MKSRVLVVAGAGVLVLALVPAAAIVQAAPARHRPATVSISIPAYAGATRLTARLPAGPVSYPLPPLPTDGQRLLGDWNGDGAQTPGIYTEGHWQLWNQLARASAAPVIDLTFGQAGDAPVTGDWNGDGITDIGVVRGNEWQLALGPLPKDGSTPPVWHDLTFGQVGATPVAGDWSGAGRDGIGMFSGREWDLAASVDDPTDVTTVSYGRPGDLPVVGDWSGTGVDGIGVVRSDIWYLSDSATAPRADRQPSLTRAIDDTPVAWRVPSAAGATTCPTARSHARGHPQWVVPSGRLGRDVTAEVGHTGRLVRGSLEQAERFLLGSQYDARWRATRSHAYLSLLGDTGDELAVRLPAMSALTVAVGMATDAHDRAVTGRTTTGAGRYVDQLVRSIACEHTAITPDGWGLGWETPHWAMLTGAAAWLVWDRLTPQTRSDVAAMVAAEADRQARLAIPYWSLPDGTVVSPGDTKAEETAWDASLLAFAATMMPKAPHAALWRAAAAERAVAAYSTEADDTSSTLVNGVPLSTRLQGFNVYPDGTVVNHDRIHPDYASAIQLLWTSADFDRLAGQPVPEADFHNAGLVYSAFSTVHYQAGAASPAGGVYAPPGGTVYVPGTTSIYYPQGDDWGTARRAHFVSLDAHATVYAPYVRASGWPAAKALAEHEKAQRALWRTSGADDGRTYSADPALAAQEDTYPGREEYAAQNLAMAWLALYVGRLGLPRLDTSTLAVPTPTAPAPRAPASAHLAP